jgi:hypothetical protein
MNTFHLNIPSYFVSINERLTHLKFRIQRSFWIFFTNDHIKVKDFQKYIFLFIYFVMKF